MIHLTLRTVTVRVAGLGLKHLASFEKTTSRGMNRQITGFAGWFLAAFSTPYFVTIEALSAIYSVTEPFQT